MSILLDTHIWLWWLTDADRVSDKERSALGGMAEREEPPFVAAISLWEAQMLVSRGRVTPLDPFERWMRRISAADVVRVIPLDADIVIALHALPVSFHGDPADRLIVATARAHGLPLATRDARIRRSRLVTLWKP